MPDLAAAAMLHGVQWTLAMCGVASLTVWGARLIWDLLSDATRG